MSKVKVMIEVYIDRLPYAREAVLRCWSEFMCVEYQPDYLDEELTHDDHLGFRRDKGLVAAHNTLLDIQYAVDEGGRVDGLSVDTFKSRALKILEGIADEDLTTAEKQLKELIRQL